MHSNVREEFMNPEEKGQQLHHYQPWTSNQLSNAHQAMVFACPTSSRQMQYDPQSLGSTDITPLPLNFIQNSQSSAMTDNEFVLLEEFIEKINKEKIPFDRAPSCPDDNYVKHKWMNKQENIGQKNFVDVYRPECSVPHYDETFTVKNAIKMTLNVGYPPFTPSNDMISSFGTPSLDDDVSDSNKPLKALSAYNFFFRHERERILSGNDSEDEIYTTDTQKVLLNSHWYRDRSQKRRHRKSHGKIDFATLSRMVSQRWKSLPEDRKNFFKEIARKDMQRYRKEQKQFEYCGPISTESCLYSTYVPSPFPSDSFRS